MAKKYILAIDQGTTGSRAFIFDSKGAIVTSSYKEFPQYFPRAGWVEHDADEIWASVCFVIKAAIGKAKINLKQIQAIGITNQRETTVLWDKKTSKPVYRAIVWQCRRTSEMCLQKKYQAKKNLIQKKTGLVLDPYFSGTKVKWILDSKKGLRKKARDGRIAFGTIDSWLIWKLTGGTTHATDMTNASRTLLFNIKTKKWDKELLKLFNIPKELLPRVQIPSSRFGETIADAASGLLAGIPITAVLGDQQAALYGQGCFKEGSSKNTYGTGCFVVVNTGKKCIYSKKGLLTTIASDALGQPVYAMEGSIFIAGAAIQWIRDELRFVKRAEETEKKIKDIKNTNGVYLVPAFVGLGAPYWNSEARGTIVGLTRGSNDKHITRAALEAICYQTKDVINVMKKELGKHIKELRVDGGACQNNFLMQFQSDILNCQIVRPKVVDSTTQGAAFLAGVTVDLWSPKDLQKMLKKDKVFNPKMKKHQRDVLYQGWQKAVQKTIN